MDPLCSARSYLLQEAVAGLPMINCVNFKGKEAIHLEDSDHANMRAELKQIDREHLDKGPDAHTCYI